MNTIIIPILADEKTEVQRGNQLAQGYTAVRFWNWDLSPGSMVVWPALLLRLDFFITSE